MSSFNSTPTGARHGFAAMRRKIADPIDSCYGSRVILPMNRIVPDSRSRS